MTCPYFPACTGCTTQDVAYDEQLARKRRHVALAVGIPEAQLDVIAGKQLGYRNRMDFVYHTGGLGLRAGKWHDVIDIEHCPIANPRVNELLTQLRALHLDPFDQRTKQGVARYAVIRATSRTDAVTFILSRTDSTTKERIASFARQNDVHNVMIGIIPPATDASVAHDVHVIKGSRLLSEAVLGLTFQFDAQGFFQANPLAERMVALVRDWLEGGRLLDLYGGVGLFGLASADKAEHVTIAEEYAPAIACAQANITANMIENADAIVMDIKELARHRLVADEVIVDPPRAGMHQHAIAAVRALSPKRIVYVSCNPTRLGQDLPFFTGYAPARAAVVDLFPQTEHCEAVVELLPR